MKPELIDPVTALADYFSGPQVGYASVSLEVGGMAGRYAERYFALRKAFGISGHDDRAVCEKKIIAAFKDNS